MSQKSYKKKEGDLEIMSDDGMTMHVYRENGDRLTIDLSDQPEVVFEDAGTEHELRPSTAIPGDKTDPQTQEIIPDATAPLWIEEVRPLLDQLNGSTKGRPDIDMKKKTTIMEIALAEWTGESKAKVFKRADTCNKFTYYHKWRNRALFMLVENQVLGIVRRAKTEAQMQSINRAVGIIREAAPVAAQVHVDLMKSANPFVQLQASGRILSMASDDTASKDGGIVVTFDAAQLADAARQAQKELDEWNEQQNKPLIDP